MPSPNDTTVRRRIERAARLDPRGLQPQDVLGGIGRPQLHRGRLQQVGGGLRDAAQHVVDDQRLAHELLHLGQLAQPLGPPGGVGVHTRVGDGERGLLGQPAQRADLLVGERPLRPVVDDERAVHPALGAERRRRDGLEALALDLRPPLVSSAWSRDR